MLSAELAFKNWRALHGYCWRRYAEIGPIRGLAGHPICPEWVLTEQHDQQRPDDQPRRYEEVDVLPGHSAIFREFAEIGWGDRKAALAFAAQYGMLDADDRFNFPAGQLPPGVDVPGRRIHVPCDPERYWTEYPAMFRVAIRLWEDLRAHRLKDLKEVLRWEKNDFGCHWVRRGDPKLLPEIIYKNRRNSTERWTSFEDPPIIANAYLRQFIERGVEFGSLCRISFVQDNSHYRFRIQPANLLAAMFLQFGQVIGGNVEQRACKACGTWFNLQPKDKGRKSFCDGNCKAREYRSRQRKAIELKATGQTPKKIAEAIDTPLETVRRWTLHKAPKK